MTKPLSTIPNLLLLFLTWFSFAKFSCFKRCCFAFDKLSCNLGFFFNIHRLDSFLLMQEVIIFLWNDCRKSPDMSTRAFRNVVVGDVMRHSTRAIMVLSGRTTQFFWILQTYNARTNQLTETDIGKIQHVLRKVRVVYYIYIYHGPPNLLKFLHGTYDS